MKIKKLEFTTSKGMFVIIDEPIERGKEISTALLCNQNFGLEEFRNSLLIGRLKDLTEEQASEIVDKSWDSGIKTTTRYPNYETNDWSYYGSFGNSLTSLHSLIKSNGWYLENPRQSTKPTDDLSFYDSQDDMEKCITDWQQAESRTLHNPVIFKIK